MMFIRVLYHFTDFPTGAKIKKKLYISAFVETSTPTTAYFTKQIYLLLIFGDNYGLIVECETYSHVLVNYVFVVCLGIYNYSFLISYFL